ncbi:hypothetical protein Clacol_005516 [Clathrus columnatus]|uniref:Tryptophan synthase beta chain-like PALP domain-containing protein n=1 Tax=Clathrus columnatus TaxID=1419009 RepID=A0AAV5ADN1_9AGAM|nr:hypothetical protein Clacol_005516 [Clathrus columnatus]
MSTTLLKGYENAPPLPDGYNADGKSLINISGPKSAYYDTFPEPFQKNKNGFDFHIYYRPNISSETAYAKELHERVRREFPELRIYRFWDKPVGPHPTAMFEVNVFDTAQTGALFSFLAVNRGPFGKVEFFSVGGSVKDRIAKRMVLEAEKEGILVPGKSVVIEPTSGNTGIGLALACAIKVIQISTTRLLSPEFKHLGLPIDVFGLMPFVLSVKHTDASYQEKETLLRALGAEVVRTPTAAPWDSEASHIGVANRLQKRIPNAVILDQYRNPNNPLAHELTTGPEIIAAVTASTSSRLSSGKVDAFIAGAGTGGTITGVARAIKKTHNKNVAIVAVDPVGSVLAVPEALNSEGNNLPYVVEGIGYDFVPEVLSRDEVDVWLKTNDQEAFAASHRLIRTEGLLVGGSSGSAMAGALKWLKGEGWNSVGGVEGANAVVLLPDGSVSECSMRNFKFLTLSPIDRIRNYMSKPWFRDTILNRPPSHLAQTISRLLPPDTSTTHAQ